ncbi:hypothetical protein [Microbacterium sp. W4I20]|uniref:hypothetical protein n=1 Tax=Microbacterium sp. W4I20 TaxID=3042262 RepID=UPI00277F20E2|nr:hypothetical protein [Microbacterium sp. W4I20]MDQ0728708.1 hypothetical protein [Microbacterium sp. W4I20]
MTEEPDAAPRQRVVRVPGSRRARLTPVPGSDPEPETAVPAADTGPRRPQGAKGPNDDRLVQDVPPHY